MKPPHDRSYSAPRRKPVAPKWTICQHTGKRRYESRKEARRAAAMNSSVRGLSPYECTICKGWHLGHLPRMVRDGDAVRWDMQPRTDEGVP